MDKELPADQLPYKPSKVSVHVTPTHLPGVQACRASVIRRRTLDLDGVARRIVDTRTEFRKETLVTVFRLMLEEIYNATFEGFNVDFGLARTDIAVTGRFESELSPFDSKQHALVPSLLPSPRLRQCVRHLRAENACRETPGPRLCFVPHFAFTPDEWELTIATQLSPARSLYKTLRVSSLLFMVEDVLDTCRAQCVLRFL